MFVMLFLSPSTHWWPCSVYNLLNKYLSKINWFIILLTVYVWFGLLMLSLSVPISLMVLCSFHHLESNSWAGKKIHKLWEKKTPKNQHICTTSLLFSYFWCIYGVRFNDFPYIFRCMSFGALFLTDFDIVLVCIFIRFGWNVCVWL